MKVNIAGRAERVYCHIAKQLRDCAGRVNPLIAYP